MKSEIVRYMLKPIDKYPFSGTLSGCHYMNESEEAVMKKYKFDDYEIRILILALNELRNQLIREERYIDAVDELIVKLYD